MYIVCSTPRSGSNMVCRALAAARVLGTPLEYFNPQRREVLTRRWGCGESLAGYVKALTAHRATPAGFFGTKLHWDQLVSLRAETLGVPYGEPEYEIHGDFLDRLFPGALYVRIIRRDVNRQAVSLWIAAQSEIWALAANDEAGAGERPLVGYSFEGIERCRRLIENGEVHWDRFLRFNGIVPFEVAYEDVTAGFPQAIRRLGTHILGDGCGPEAVPDAPDTRVLSDARSGEFLERFTAELAARGWEDPRGG